MKRVLVLLLTVFSCAVVCASDFSFEAFPATPLFEDIKFDPYSMSTSLRYMFFLDENQAPTSVRGIKYKLDDDQNGEYTDVTFFDRPKNSYLKMKLGTNIGLLRFSFDKVKLEANVQGGLNTIFNLYGSAVAFGFDGTFQVGLNLSVYDIVFLSFGLHHFSGHYGDELLSRVKEHIEADVSFASCDFTPLEYVRDNLYALCLSIKPIKEIRTYFVAYLPKTKSWVRPYVHVPEYVNAPSNNRQMQEHGQSDEHVEDSYNASTMIYPSSYMAWELQTGVELNFRLWDFAQFYVVVDVKLHQDGQTKHLLGYYYSKNPWEIDYLVGLGFAIDKVNGGHLGVEVSYHDARMPLLNMFYHHGRYLSVGVSIIE